MAQFKKDAVRESINDAALDVFYQKGYLSAKVSDIAALSGVSVGNIYRYYKNKDEIFYSVLPEEFTKQFIRIIHSKIGSAKNGLTVDSPIFQVVSEPFIQFILEHRKRIAILFLGSQSTKYESVSNDFALNLLALVKEIYKEKYESYIARYKNDDMILLIYHNLIRIYGHLLSQPYTDEELIKSIEQVNQYHFSGIISLINF